MGRVLAIDYGTKRVGLAVSDPLKIIGTPLDTIHAKDVIAYLKDYHNREVLECFVLGIPKRFDNSDTDATPLVRIFAKLLRKNFPEIPIHWVDERFTSKLALDAMIRAGSKKKDRKKKTGNLDKISATIILQSFLENYKS